MVPHRAIVMPLRCPRDFRIRTMASTPVTAPTIGGNTMIASGVTEAIPATRETVARPEVSAGMTGW
jgi:hypothetical protein